jgi:ATP-dependent RNA helicase DOB1
MVVVPMALELIASISALRISIPPDLRPADARRSVLLQLQVWCDVTAGLISHM